MIPGKPYTPEVLLQVVWRHRWRLILPFVLIASVASAITYALPNRYQSDTLVLVVPQRVPENYVRSAVTMRIEDRLQAISQQILSRTRLERIIQEFNQVGVRHLATQGVVARDGRARRRRVVDDEENVGAALSAGD